MYDFGEDDYDFIKELRKGGDLADKKPKQIKQEEIKMIEQKNYVRIEIGQYQFAEIDLSLDTAAAKELVDKAVELVQHKDSKLNATKPAPTSTPAPTTSAPAPAPTASTPKPAPAPAPTSAPAPQGDNKYPDAGLEQIKISANQAYNVVPIQCTGSSPSNYGGNMYYYIIEIDGKQYKTIVGKTAIAQLFDSCIASPDTFVLTLGKDGDNHWYVLDNQGNKLV